jgi:acetyl esterase
MRTPRVLDPQAQRLLERVAQREDVPLASLTPVEARRGSIADREFHAAPMPMAEVRDLSIPLDGRVISARLYHPASRRRDALLLWLHGGDWIIGDLDDADVDCRALAAASGLSILSADYRLAPEHPYPAGLDDAYRAVAWAARTPQQLDLEPGFFLAVGGDSAGGNLAAAVALRARDEGEPRIDFQLLVYPVTDHVLDIPSYESFGEGYWLTTEEMAWAWDHYLPDRGRRSDPLASPLRASSHRGLPPALVITAEFDPLRDEGEAYAEKLRAAGVPVKRTRYAGMIHGFFSCGGAIDAAHDAIAECGEALRAAADATLSAAANRRGHGSAVVD